MDCDPEQDFLRLRRDYIRRLRHAGGLPVLLPHTEKPLSPKDAAELLAGCQGVLFSGGGDLETSGGGRGVDPERDQAELSLFAAAWERKLPVFGVCRGLQLINTALGGDLYPDLGEGPGRVRHCHASDERYDCHHRVTVTRRELSRLIGTAPDVNSHHHQGLRRLASPLRAAAFAPDGLCEAVLGPPYRFLLAVQWHPECLDHMAPLFAAFAEACRKHTCRKHTAGDI